MWSSGDVGGLQFPSALMLARTGGSCSLATAQQLYILHPETGNVPLHPKLQFPGQLLIMLVRIFLKLHSQKVMLKEASPVKSIHVWYRRGRSSLKSFCASVIDHF